MKLSGMQGFWFNHRNTDPDVHTAAKSFQRALKKVDKAYLDVRFLTNCKQRGLFPKFVRWKNLNGFSSRDQRKHYLRNLNDALSNIVMNCQLCVNVLRN